jgi:hypothetical protein
MSTIISRFKFTLSTLFPLNNSYMFRLIVLSLAIVGIFALSLQTAFADPSNGPANPGPIVMRYDGDIGIFQAYEGNGISAIYGGDVVEFCLTGDTEFDLVHIQDVAVPEDANRIVELIHGYDVNTTVWPFVEFDCDLFTSTEPLAAGAVDMRQTDNDLLVFLNPDNVNANAFGYMVHGRVYDKYGTRMNLNAFYRAVWDGNDPESFNEVWRIHLR